MTKIGYFSTKETLAELKKENEIIAKEITYELKVERNLREEYNSKETYV